MVAAASPLDVSTHSYGPDPAQRFDVVTKKAAPKAGLRPIAIFFHGGVWQMGDRRDGLGLVGTMAERGFVGVTASYRLAPKHPAPAQLEDASAVVAAVVARAADFGGDPARIVLVGHSAGGHLASLLVFDEQARRQGKPAWSASAIKAVVALSGVFDLRAPLDEQQADGGFARFIAPVFGRSTDALRHASPIDRVSATTVPFLLVTATEDYKAMQAQTAAMSRTLRLAKVDSTVVTVADHDHFGLVSAFGDRDDATARAVFSFLDGHGLLPR